MPHPERVFRSMQMSWAPDGAGEDSPWMQTVLQCARNGSVDLPAFFLLLALPVHAADCPPLLDAALPTLSDDKPESICQYKGKVLLVVNTASQCGYTPQYEGLEKLYKRYKDKGLVVLGFPSNDFGGQEPGSNKEIAKFCEANYGVSLPDVHQDQRRQGRR